jgi:O-antigen biosynthesis protein
MKLSILIVNYNQKYFPRLCVESLQKSKGCDFEIIFCDNNSTDESLEYLKEARERGEIKLVEPGRNVGFGTANNLAFKEAQGEYVLILNADITVEEDTLAKMLEYLKEHDEVGILAPKLIYHNGDVQPSCRRNFKFWDLFIKRSFLKHVWPFSRRNKKYLMQDFNHESVQEVDLVTGAFMMMRRSVFEQVRGFDERYFLFMEDFDLCKKVAKAGYKVVYFPKAQAVHYHKRLSDGGVLRLLFKKISWMHFVSALKYFWKWRK